MKVTILSGGLSCERDAALCGSTYVADALRNLGHEVALIDMYMGIEDYPGSTLEDLFRLPIPEKWRFVNPVTPNLQEIELSRVLKSSCKLGAGVIELLQMSDVVFLSLGGDYGEDGRIQGMLDILGIPYTGSRHTGAAIAIDKTLTKEIVQMHNVLTSEWIELTGSESSIVENIKSFGIPCVIKNPTGGSSIGTFIIHEESELYDAVHECLKLNNRVLVESYIKGREFTCGVLDDRPLPSIEIITTAHDYQNKYINEIKEVCPAQIPSEVENQIQNAALTVHKSLRLSSFSRSDFILAENGKIYFLECNVLPGLTPRSLLPKEAMAAGINYETLCSIMLNSAFKK